MFEDLHITPHGALKCSGDLSPEGTGPLLFELVCSKVAPELAPALFFQKIFREYVVKLSEDGDLPGKDISERFAKMRPNESDLRFSTLCLPPMLGGEYFDFQLLQRFYIDFEEEFQRRFNNFNGTFTDFIRSLNPAWKDVGKVSFHLAENKADSSGERPFAFMASFIHRISSDDKPKHLPLAAALKAYANDKKSLEVLLVPIQTAAEKSSLIKELLESRRIFQPCAWTSREAYRFLQDIPIFEQANIVVRIANLWKKSPPKAKVSISLNFSKKSNFGANSLLNFSVGVTLDGETLTKDEIDAILNSAGGLVRIRGQWIEAEPEKIASLLEQWKNAEELAKQQGLSLLEGFRLLAGADSSATSKKTTDEISEKELCCFEAVGELRKLLDEMRNPGQLPLPDLPANLAKTLRPYQLEGVKYLWRTTSIGLGTCLADDMGLGKTLQVLALVELWRRSGALKELPALLILPATLLANWQNESARFTPDLKLCVLHPSAMSKEASTAFAENPAKYLSGFDLALTTYGMLHRMPELAKLDFPALIADEAQAIKNPTAKQSRALRSLRGKYRIALTGTPVENSLTDLWSIFDFINPGLLGNLNSFLDFTKKIQNNYSSLRKLTQPFILRRLKTDKRIISDLPDKTELKVYCNLSKMQAALYAKSVEELEKSLKENPNGIKRKGIVLAFLMRFKQICNHPAHYLGNNDFSAEASGKFLRISELVESIASRQEKLLVFTQFREMTEPLRAHLKDCFGRDGIVLHGGTAVSERAKLVNLFQQDDGPPFFVLSLKAGGTGLNLTAANHVIHFDRWWNPAVENQATDRAFRIGQKSNVLVHKFICRGTFEEKIDKLITEKQNLADELLSEGAEKLLTSMSNEELMNFVKLDINTITEI